MKAVKGYPTFRVNRFRHDAPDLALAPVALVAAPSDWFSDRRQLPDEFHLVKCLVAWVVKVLVLRYGGATL